MCASCTVAVNFQPWKFAVITEKKLLEALKSAYPREWIKTAPCIIVACGDHNVAWHRKLDNKDHTDVDVSIAVEHCVWLQPNKDWEHAGYAILMYLSVRRYWDCLQT